jgi:hypothetical protein
MSVFHLGLPAAGAQNPIVLPTAAPARLNVPNDAPRQSTPASPTIMAMTTRFGRSASQWPGSSANDVFVFALLATTALQRSKPTFPERARERHPEIALDDSVYDISLARLCSLVFVCSKRGGGAQRKPPQIGRHMNTRYFPELRHRHPRNRHSKATPPHLLISNRPMFII